MNSRVGIKRGGEGENEVIELNLLKRVNRNPWGFAFNNMQQEQNQTKCREGI